MATPKESPAEAARRLAATRVPAAVSALELVGRLGGRHYSLTPEQISHIVREIQNAVDRMKLALHGTSFEL